MSVNRRLFVLLLLVVAVVLSAPGGGFAGEVDAELAARLSAADDDTFVRVMVRMEEQPFVSAFIGADVVRRVLRETASRTQVPVVEYLTAREKAGDVRAFTAFWLVNVVFAEIRAHRVAELADLPGVELVYDDIVFSVPQTEFTPLQHDGEGVEPSLLRWEHVAAVFAPELWDLGYRGQGITVAVLDTGVDIAHPDLDGAMGGQGPYHEGYWAEFDRNGNEVAGSVPRDTGTHGTHVSGTVGARNLTYEIGVAPEVTLAHGLVIPGGTGSFPQVLAGLQWAAEQKFDIVNGSLGINDIVPDMATATDNLVAAGVVPVFANGNIQFGSVPPGAPGNTPSAIAVGGFDEHGEEGSFNRGDIVEYPGYDYDEFTRIKPDIGAPGVGVLSTYPGGGWAAANGTSMASPHVAGVVALLLSANPALTVNDVKEILYASTGGHKERFGWEDIATKETRFGWGRVNALQALQLAKDPDGEPVEVVGTVTGEGVPLADATVTFAGFEGHEFTTDADGHFAGLVARGIYTVTATAPQHASETRTVNLIGVDGPVSVDFDLDRIHTGTLKGTVSGVASWPGEPGPISGAVVSVPGLDLQTTTNADGEFVFPVVRVGSWSVVVNDTDHKEQELTVDVRRDETTVVDVVLEPTGGVVSFKNSFDTAAERAYWTIIDDAGSGGWGFTDARSVSAPYSAWSGGDDGTPPYPSHQSSRLVSPEFTVLPGGEHLRFRLWAHVWGPFHTFRLRVHDVAADEKTELFVFDDFGPTASWQRVYFDLSAYTNRRIKLEFVIETDELTRADEAGVFIDDVVVGALEPEMLSRLRGTVTNSSSRILPGAIITAVEQNPVGDEAVVLQTMTGRDGRFELALPGGNWSVRVSKTKHHVPTERTVFVFPRDRNSVLFSLADNTPPGTVGNLAAEPDATGVRLTWASVDDADLAAYNVYVSRAGADFRRVGATTDANFVVEGLVGGETYVFRVAAMDAYGLEGDVAEVEAVPTHPGPTVTSFDVQPRSIVRGGSVSITASLDHAADAGARLHVLLEAKRGSTRVGWWEFADVAPGDFAARVDAADGAGAPWVSGVYTVTMTVTDPDGNRATANAIAVAVFPPLPASLSFLLGNNPFNPGLQSQRIEYSVPVAGHLHVAVYGLDGRLLRVIVDEERQPGTYAAYWDGTDDEGRIVLSGMYVVRARFIDGDGRAIELTRHSVVVK